MNSRIRLKLITFIAREVALRAGPDIWVEENVLILRTNASTVLKDDGVAALHTQFLGGGGVGDGDFEEAGAAPDGEG